ncbi:MAG: excinuclease ABC subunit C [Candidatus Tokpelaia sp. JSC189]|nr:MAG: excinuclease ABC subunit C [Candidatus Tokpelaia sp. JSC189]
MIKQKSYDNIDYLEYGDSAESDIAGTLPNDDDISIKPLTVIDWNMPSNIPSVKGVELIAEFVKRLPDKPGVYRMLGENSDVLYVGKAQNLKKRVANYTHPERQINRIARMISATCNMEFIVTSTETEALLLESNLIKRLRPRFNILLRDDKSFPYITITRNHWAPGIFKHRGAHIRKGDYFGPFASAMAVNRTINSLQRAFLLRICKDSVFETRSRPCLLYQIKRCSGPCTNEISNSDYALLVEEAKAFLSGKSQKVKEQIAASMLAASEAMDFECAALYRDRLAALSHVQTHQEINPQTIDEADIFAICQEEGLTSIQVFFFRTGQNWGNHAYFPKVDPSLPVPEVLKAFLAQFYDNKPLPKLILLSHEIAEHSLLIKALSLKANHKVQIITPRCGEKKELIKHALTNARESLGRKLAEISSQAKLLEGLAKTFALPHKSQRIEVYDNSHIMGTNSVGAMIVAGSKGFVKSQYRKFNIRSTEITPGDDCGMMREVIERRFSRLVKECGLPRQTKNTEDNDTFPSWPDIILIDGGKGQINTVDEVLKKMGIQHFVTVIGIAKGINRNAGREHFFIEGKLPFFLSPRDPVLYFIQRLRDEAHRFAIGAHRTRRKKEMIKNLLDEIEGVGPKRKQALLNHFGTAHTISRAAVEDLMKIKGISQAIAQTIQNHFNER